MRETVNQIMSNVDVAPGTRTKRIANNTVKYTHADGSTRWRLHQTDVVSLKDGVYTLNSGGWLTPTTKDRINSYAPVSLHADRGNWYLTAGVPFFDGMTVDESGVPRETPRLDETAAKDKIRKRINKFCRLVDTVDILPTPDDGDCWMCSMIDKEGKQNGIDEHLWQHIKEGYLHGSLLVNAMRDAGYRDDGIRLHYSMNLRDTFKRKLRRYLNIRLVDRMAPDIHERRFA